MKTVVTALSKFKSSMLELLFKEQNVLLFTFVKMNPGVKSKRQH